MRLIGSTILLCGVVAVLGGCSEELRPGRCNQTSDCAGMPANAGQICNLDLTPQGNGRCVPACQNAGECEGGRVCDFDQHGQGRCLLPVTPDGGGGDGGGDGDAGDDSPHCPVCSGTTPVCVGVTCVECATSADCSSDPTKPICNTTNNSCERCISDDECSAKLGADPGVCMAHQDGRCATDAETIYVEPKTGTDCRNVLQDDLDGTAALPFCNIDLARRVLASDSAKAQPRTLVRVRGTSSAAIGPFTRTPGRSEVSIIGQPSAVIAGGAQQGLDLRSGSFYLRGLKVSASVLVGINAAPTASDSLTLRLDTVTVDSCLKGGIFLAGVAFEIRNTTVTRNGPSDDLSWGGIRVQALPVSGPSVLDLVTVQNNNAAGVSCAAGAPIQGTGVFASDNAAGQIASTCGIIACSPLSSTCGASP